VNADLPVIALAVLIVIAEDARSIAHECQPVLEAVLATRAALRQLPDYQFGEGAVPHDVPFLEK